MNIRLLTALLALPLFVFSERGLAQSFSGSFGNCNAMPSSVSVSPPVITSPVKAGEALGSWFPMGVVIWMCEIARPNLGPQVGVDFGSGARIEREFTEDGQQYAVMSTSNPDIGIIYRASIGYPFEQRNNVPYYVTAPSAWNQVGSMSSAALSSGAPLSIALVPEARLIQLNNVVLDDYVAPQPLQAALRRVDNSGTETGMTPAIFNFTPFYMSVAASCDVSIPTVTMPTLALGNFHGISDTPVTTQPFDIRLTDCTAGLTSLGYTISTNNSTNAARTIARVDASSQASGIGLGLLTRNGSSANIVFDQENHLTDNPPSMITLPMQAALYQIDANVTPGEYRGSFNFKLVYK